MSLNNFAFLQHIVVEVDLGEKSVERFKSSNTEFTKYAMMNVRTKLFYLLKYNLYGIE